MRSGLADLRYEVQRKQNQESERDQVTFWKNSMKFAFVGLEGVNEKLGPIMKLKGWANEITSNMEQFERPLRAIHRSHFMRKKANPFVQIGLTILMSIVVFHFREQGSRMCSNFSTSDSKTTTAPRGLGEDDGGDGGDDIQPPPGQQGTRNYNSPQNGMNGLGTLANLFKMFSKK